MRIYLAASFSTKVSANLRADEIRSRGHEITSSWLSATNDSDPLDDAGICVTAALTCFADIARADLLIQVVPPRTSPGKYVELGIAVALQKEIVIVGGIASVFHYHPAVIARCCDWEEVFIVLSERSNS